MTRGRAVATKKYRYVEVFKDRHGRERVYYRAPGRKRIPLKGPFGSSDFVADYERVVAEAAECKEEAAQATRGTWRWLCERYFKSIDYKSLDASTQRVRRRIIEITWQEPAPNGKGVVYADCPLDRMNARLIRILRDRKHEHPEAANSRVKAIRAVFVWACEAEHAPSNPARDVKYLKSATGGFHTWTEDEIAKYEERYPIGTKPRLALALFLYTGQRRSDIVRFGRQHVKNGWIRFTQHKNRNRSPMSLELPILPGLQAIIDKSPVGDLTWLVTEFGKPFTSNGFGNKMREWCNAVGLPECSSHGLRKASARRLAEWGATTEQIKAWCGWRTAKEADRYLREVNQRRLANSVVPLFAKGKSGT